MTDDLDIARTLIFHGIPVFVATPATMANGEWDPLGGHAGCGYWLPPGWQHTRPDMHVLDDYRPGDALGMVCGHGVDVVDTDPRNGGENERAALDDAGIMPTVYGRAQTPSGGTHELITSLGVRKGTPRPGLDVQAGDKDGAGRGFVFLAPTRRAAKDSGGRANPENVRTYTWEWIDLERWSEDRDTDDTGEALAELVGRVRVERDERSAAEPGPEYTEMPVSQRESVDRYISKALASIAAELDAAGSWRAGYRDDRGRGWEKLTADECYRLGALARAPWTRLTFTECHELLRKHAPTDAGWTRVDVDAKWRSQRGRGNAAGFPDSLVSLEQLGGDGHDDGHGGSTTAAATPERAIGANSMQESAPTVAPTTVVRTHGQVHIAERFEVDHAGRLVFVHGVGWHYWDGKRWAEDVRGHASRAVVRTLRTALSDSLTDPELRKDVAKCESASGIRGVLEIAQSADVFAKTVTDLDADPYLVNCANGTLDLHTMQLRPHDPADLLTKITRGAWRPEAAESSAWPGFLNRVLPDDEVRRFLQRYVGLALAGTVLEHVLAILVGAGRNGKSVFYRAVNYALGDYATAAEPDLFVATKDASLTNTAGQMALLGRRWVVVSESDDGRPLAEATVKRLTGGDTITARRLYGQLVTFEPSHTAVLVTNYLPKVRGGDPALWARLVVVPFEVTIPPDEQDPELAERLQLEADAVLAWAVAGYVAYRAQGLNSPARVESAIAAYRSDSDTFSRFVAERCTTTSPALSVSMTDLWAAWSKWCAEEGLESGSKLALAQALDRAGYESRRGTGGVRFRFGIGLLPTEEQ